MVATGKPKEFSVSMVVSVGMVVLVGKEDLVSMVMWW